MEKTGYICFMIILKMLGIKNDQKALEEKFMKIEDTDIAIIRIAKEMGLKVKAARFSERIFNKLTVPVIARCKDGRYILILGIHEDKCKILLFVNLSAPDVFCRTIYMYPFHRCRMQSGRLD